MHDFSTFDASARQAIDAEGRNLADGWFCHNGKDLTDFQGISYGGLLRLPVFLSCQVAGRVSNGSMSQVLQSGLRFVWEGLRLLGRRNVAHTHPIVHREYIFLIAKHLPHSAIVKTLDPLLRAFPATGEHVRVWTFDEVQRSSLQAQYPNFPCENLTDVRVRPRDICAVAWMLFRASSQLLRGKQRPLMYEPLAQLFYHAPRFLQIQSLWKTLWHPGMVILSATEMHPLERLVITLANSEHVPTVLIQHGITNGTIKNEVVNTPSIASRLCVWGECAKTFFVSHGAVPERISVTGSPALSQLFESHQTPSRAEVLTHFALPDVPFILFSGQNFDERKNTALTDSMLEAYSSIFKTHPATKLIITPHPAKSQYTTDGFYRHLVQKHDFKEESQIFIRSTKNIYDLVSVCDILVTSSSTLHVEAAVLEKLVVLLNIDGVPDMEMVPMKAALGAHNADELSQCLKGLQDESVRGELLSRRLDFLRAYATYPQDATSTILELVRNLPSTV